MRVNVLISCSQFYIVPAHFISCVLVMRSLLEDKTKDDFDSIQILKKLSLGI